MKQVANIITPNGQIQQVQLAPMNQLQVQGIPGLQAAQGATANQQQNVVMVQPSVTSSPVATSNGLYLLYQCKNISSKRFDYDD